MVAAAGRARRLGFIALLGLVGTGVLPLLAAEPAAPDVREANKAVVQRYIEEVLAAGDLKALDEIVAPDFADRTPGAPPGKGPDVLRAAQKVVRSLFKDIQYDIDQLVAEGDKVVARYSVRAVRRADPQPDAGNTGNTGNAGDIGKEIAITGMTLFRLGGGRIEEIWTINDQLTMFRQLGYSLVPPKPAKKADPKRTETPPKLKKAKPPS